MNTFGKQTYRLLDKTKPYQRKKLSHAGPETVNREAELPAPTGVGSGDLLGGTVVIIWSCKTPRALGLHNKTGDHPNAQS